MATKTKLIKIGNSKGVRIPKALIEQANLVDEVELEVQAGKLVVKQATTARSGWDEDLAKLAQTGEDEVLEISELSNEWDEAEWEW